MTAAGTTSPGAPATPGPLDRRRPRVFFAILLAFVAVVGTVGASHRFPHGARALDLGAFLLLAVAPLVVGFALRRRVTAVVVTVAALTAYVLAGYPLGPVFGSTEGVLVALVLSGPARSGRIAAWSGLGALAVAVPLAFTARDEGFPSPAAIAGGLAWSCVLLLLAGAIRGRYDRLAERRGRAREAAARREHDAVTAERLRIARELHDVLAHSLSAISVQAGVGLHLLDRDVEQARSALTQIRATSSEALGEVRAVLGIVRADDGTSAGGHAAPGAGQGGGQVADPSAGDPDDPADAPRAPRTPSWTLDALPRLVDEFTVPGGPVATLDLALDPGVRAHVPPHVAGVVFRVVQEALTNARRHAAGATRVEVRVAGDAGARELVVRVRDDGVGARTDAAPGATSDAGEGAPSSGYGLRGMRERVEAAGGVVRAGARGDGARGFEVEARVPLAPPDLSERGGTLLPRASDKPAEQTELSEHGGTLLPRASDNSGGEDG
ncbi:sensor histidine kinase [Luteimicrobium sp. NPDC057192]|uniref:sensor histidine kinase n=1 Tax=Luteimicrobium sp. NPDC057192 TaxID=3346042 RepID=UPI00364540E1